MKYNTTFPILIFLLIITLYSCKTASVKRANQLFETGEYDAAYTMYQAAVNKVSSDKQDIRTEVYIKMGICSQYIQRVQPAENAYSIALRLKSKSLQLRLQLAMLYHRQAKYAAAIAQYKLCLASDSGNILALNGLKGCQLADTLKKYPSRYIVKTETRLNSNRSDFAPVLFGKEYDQVYFSSTREQAVGKKKSRVTGQKNSDIFISKKNNNGVWEAPKPMPGVFNTPSDEGVVSFNGDFSDIYFTRCQLPALSSSPAEIFTSKRADAAWGEPRKLMLLKDSTEMFAHPAISPKGDYLYFVSDRPGGMGGKDIWRSKIEGGKFLMPENLGNQINTPGDEMYPYIRENGELYFSTNGLPGLGGLDIFVAEPLSENEWKVKNMGIPVNSFADDFGISFAGLDEMGFLSSNRSDAKGFDRIFSFEMPSVKRIVEGSVKNDNKQPLVDARLHIVNDNGYNSRQNVNKDGTFRFKAEKGLKYLLLASCKGYLNSSKEIEIANQDKDAVYKADFSLIPISKPIAINNIFFDVAKATLRPESTESLNQVVKMLKENPNITIELSAHTDMNGTDEYNLKLSEDRAASVVAFLISGGIEKDRLTPKGYGKSQPRVVDESMAQKYKFLREGDELNEAFILKLQPQQQEIVNQINRRTEFRVLKTTYNLF